LVVEEEIVEHLTRAGKDEAAAEEALAVGGNQFDVRMVGKIGVTQVLKFAHNVSSGKVYLRHFDLN
jgi:hypothetical protein